MARCRKPRCPLTRLDPGQGGGQNPGQLENKQHLGGAEAGGGSKATPAGCERVNVCTEHRCRNGGCGGAAFTGAGHIAGAGGVPGGVPPSRLRLLARLLGRGLAAHVW
eukprot:scaffold1733_cov123-Isochrysis_galbana.AAC.6